MGHEAQKIFIIALLGRIWHHFKDQHCLRMATALSYQTLLAIVPLAAVIFALFTAIPAFTHLKQKLTTLLFDNLLPSKISTVDAALSDFAVNASQLTYFGLAGIAITALMLMSSIEEIFSQIWQVAATRNPFKRLITYIVITLIGPIAVGTSLTLVNWIVDISEEATGFEVTGAVALLSFIMPFLLPFAILFILFRIVPACDVKWRHAFIGAAVATALFLLGKHMFRLYLEYFPSYEVVYGAMAAIPLFLIWLYVSWGIVLFGATIAAVLGFEFTADMEKR
ncbi:YihY family inner membrane protein [Sneathiella sp. CAU 1612]|uniref:YihY family inner membrane protein n=1 Tax=Sneathiella sedimenti TaxID=2816034 RepID=A0ABS3F337_9PROT|nr:YihY family inner membrane protein [Sneathiella sedimenti]